MNFKSYYRLMLLLPIIAPFFSLFFDQGFVAAILVISLGFAGIEYLIFAIFFFVYIGYIDSIEGVKRLAWLAPLLFIPVAIIGWYISQFWSRGLYSSPAIQHDAIPLIFVYGIIIGYGYCFIVEIVFRILKSCKLISLGVN